MTKQEKMAVINGLTEQLNAYPHFYLADIEALNAEQTAACVASASRRRLSWLL